MDLRFTLEGILQDLAVFSPEIVLVFGSIVFLISGLVTSDRRILTAVYVVVLLISLFFLSPESGSYFEDFVRLDDTSYALKIIFITAGALLPVFGRKDHQLEFYFLSIALVVGSMFMVSFTNLLLIYLSIELTSYSGYLLAGLRFSKKGTEAALKYLLFGGVSSAIMLFGISLLYGSSGSMLLTDLEFNYLSTSGIILFFAGVLFKASVFPLHLWVPNTYQGAPGDSVALFSVVPKLAGFGLIYQLLPLLKEDHFELLSSLLMVLALISVLWGTLSALVQKNIKRLISFGAIAHSGFLLPLVVISPRMEIQGFLYYAVVYAIMSYGAFYLVDTMEKKLNKSIFLQDINGFGRVNGVWASMFVIVLISLIGLPPAGGFTAKLILFSQVWVSFEQIGSNLWLTYFLVGILSTVASLFFYLRIPYHMFLMEASHSGQVRRFEIALATFFVTALLILFFYPSILDSV